MMIVFPPRLLALFTSSLLVMTAFITTTSSAFQVLHVPTSTTMPPLPLGITSPLPLNNRRPSSLPSSTALKYSIDITENAPRDTTTSTEWAINYGTQLSDSFELASSSNDVNNVYATSNQNLGTETPILSVPSDLILTGQKARQELGTETNGAEQSLMLSDHQQFYLFLKILKEYELGEQSPWYYYLNSLPRYYCNGASMTDFCFGCLPPYAAGLALAEKRRLKQFTEALNNVSFISMESKSNEELTKWAYNVVYTRCVENPGGDMVIVPMADYFNHGAEPNVYITYDEVGNSYVYTARDIQAGEPLVLSYGDSTNPSNLMARYGFLDDSSPATFCKYVIDNPTYEMFTLGYPSSMLFYNDGGISNEVWDVLLYELLKVSPDEQQSFYQAHTSGDEGTKASYHEQYFAQTYQAIQSHVTYILNEINELGIGIETQMAQGQDAQRHPRLPLIMGHNEFVKMTFDNVQKNLDNMYA